VVDQLRLLWNRPLRDGDRRRLFAIAVVFIAAAAVLLTLHGQPDAPDGHAIEPRLPPIASSSPVTLSFPLAAATAEQSAPSEEGDPTAARTASAADVAASERAARAFLAGYLPFTYGHAVHLRAATAALRHTLRSHPPRVPRAERRRHPRVVALQTDGVSRELAQLTALVDDGARRYTVTLELAHRGTGWLVTGLGD
jgi:hypothetical protein